MGFVSVSGEPGCRPEDLARLTARRLECELVTEPTLDLLLAQEFGEGVVIPPKAWPDAVTSVLAGLGAKHHVVFCIPGSELLLPNFPAVLRVHLVASPQRRTGDLMIDRQVDRTEAKRLLREWSSAESRLRKARFGKVAAQSHRLDLVLNSETFPPEQALEHVVRAAQQKQILDSGLLSPGTEAQVQFQMRFRLAKFGLAPSSRAHVRKRQFGHPSEEVFANLLDFYRVRWEYEPRSFPLQWDVGGKIQEAFTPDFYLPEFDLYVELTTMKQALVTRKNRKIRLLRAIYPHINIQVFYQKDVQELVMKYGQGETVAS